MSSRGLTPDVMLSVHLDAICSRNRFTHDPGPVIDEIRAAVGDRVDIRDETVGCWVGFFRDEYTAPLCDALLAAFPGAVDHVPVGERRRGPNHSTAGYTAPLNAEQPPADP